MSDSEGIIQLVEDVRAGNIEPASAVVHRQVGEVVPGAVLELCHQPPHAGHGGQLGVEEEEHHVEVEGQGERKH